MFDRSRACGRYRISMLDRPDAVNIAVVRLEFPSLKILSMNDDDGIARSSKSKVANRFTLTWAGRMLLVFGIMALIYSMVVVLALSGVLPIDGATWWLAIKCILLMIISIIAGRHLIKLSLRFPPVQTGGQGG